MNLKRLFDLLFSSIALVLASPLFLLIFLLIKATSKGPAFHQGTRMGQGGKLIRCTKFRSMCLDAEERLKLLLIENPQMHEEWKAFRKLKKDPRRTLVGKFLRKNSLDELPQLWDVLMGRLSVVGPRPIEVRARANPLSEIRSLYKEKTEKILSAKPGITCLWQVRGRNTLTMHQRAEMEVEYIETQSFWLDLKIIARTIWILLFPKGAY